MSGRFKGEKRKRTPCYRGWRWDETKKEIIKRDGLRCVECGMNQTEHLIKTGQPLQVDHILAYNVSRNNNPENLQTLCAYCHGAKQKIDIEFCPL